MFGRTISLFIFKFLKAPTFCFIYLTNFNGKTTFSFTFGEADLRSSLSLIFANEGTSINRLFFSTLSRNLLLIDLSLEIKLERVFTLL